MGNENKNRGGGSVPPGAQSGGQSAAQQRQDVSPVVEGQTGIEPDRHRVCTCCKQVTTDQDWVRYLWMCIDCANGCDGDEICKKLLCKCAGDCCAEHKKGEQCEDKAVAVLGKIGDVLLHVCAECGAALLKKLLVG